MPASNTLQLVIEVTTDAANRNIDKVNAGLARIEQVAVRSSQGASRGIDSLTGSMAKGVIAGNAFTAAIEKAFGVLKSLTIEAAEYAARTETLGVALDQLAKSNDLSVEAVRGQVEAVKALGITTQDARTAIAQMIAAQIDLSRATELARLAQDAAVIAGKNSSETLAGIVHGIVTQQIEVLRTYGIQVNFERTFAQAQQRVGRELTETERKMAAFNAVLEQAPKFAGAYEAALGTVGKQQTSLTRYVLEAKNAIGEQFLPQMRQAISVLTDLAKWARDNAQAIGDFTKAMVAVATVITAYNLPGLLLKIAAGIRAITLAVAANPWGLVAAGVATLGFALYEMHQRLEENALAFEETARRAKIMDEIRAGRSLEELKKLGYTAEQIKDALTGGRRALDEFQQDFSNFDFGAPIRLRIAEERNLQEELQRQKELRQKIKDAEEKAHDLLVSAQKQELAGLAKIIAEYNIYRQEIGLSAKANRDLAQATVIRLRAEATKELKESAREHLKQLEEQTAIELEARGQQMLREKEFQSETLKLASETLESRLNYEQTVLQQARDAQLRQLEFVDARTVEQKVDLERRKLAIEEDFLLKSFELKAATLDREAHGEIATMEIIARARFISEEEIARRRDELLRAYAEKARQLEASTQDAINTARENASIRQTQIVRDANERMAEEMKSANQRVFDQMKSASERVFDAMLQKGQSIWSALAGALKNAVLTVLREIVTSQVARALSSLLTGQRVALAPGGSGGGVLGRLGGLLGVGAIPVFGAGSITGGPGGTGGFAGPVTTGGSTTAASVSNLAGLGAKLKDFLGFGGCVQYAPGKAVTWQSATLGQKLSALGRSDVAALAGGLLALDGLRRGGFTGLAETTAGGALLGFKFGGPIGAAIGGIVGAVAGLVRLFKKSAEEKAREKIRAVYGVDIKSNSVLTQIVEMAKQGFGGNLDLAIRSPQIRDLIELYALSTGQSTAGLPAKVRPVSLVQQGGVLYQASSPSGIALDRIGAGAPQNAGSIVIKLDGEATTALLRGEAVQTIADNPRLVQSAAMTATRANAGRRELLALQLSPGTLTT
jgi:hypothetical protein